MPRNSLKKLMDLFPWFLDKSESSNFHKSQYVTNRRFQEIYNDLFKIYNSFHLEKNCLIWKDQSEPYDYQINFVASFPYLKTVTLYKNDDVIYSESFSYDDEVDSFKYSYEDSTLNDVEDENLADIIPQHEFKIIVTTHEEYTISKGWPENDTLQGNIFDHDTSLDRFGKLHDIPRKEYLIVEPEFYPATEPPYNDRATEDDYHYMNRIIEYNLRLWANITSITNYEDYEDYLKKIGITSKEEFIQYKNNPVLFKQQYNLPALEIWKLYGIPATMENREKLILKVFDLEKHPNHIDPEADGDGWYSGTYNEETDTLTPWTPEQWEHLDKFCDYDDILGKYFFVKISTNTPVKHQDVLFSFKFLNSLAQELPGDHTIEIWLNNTLITRTTSSYYTLKSNDIPQDYDSVFTVIGKDGTGEVIGTEEVLLSVRGCNSADYYVSNSGSDTNDGRTRTAPFKTLQKAVNTVNGDKNLIAILGGAYTITSPVALRQSCTIMGCGSVIIENTTEDLFFTIPSDATLILEDLTLQYRGDICDVNNVSFTNNNGDGSLAKVLILFTNAPILTATLLSLTAAVSVHFPGVSNDFTATLKDKYGTAISGATINFTVNDGTSCSGTTNSSGKIVKTVETNIRKNLAVSANYAGDGTNYKPSNASLTLPVVISISEVFSNYDYVVLDMNYNSDGDWEYETIATSDIMNLYDIEGAIMNLTYNEDMTVTFDRFTTTIGTGQYMSRNDIQSLKGLLVGLEYDEGDVEYLEIELLTSTDLTITGPSNVNVGETVSFSGVLKDRFDNGVNGEFVTVNNTRCVTNNNGEFSGSLTAGAIGELVLTAEYEGSIDYSPSSATDTVIVKVPLSSVLDDYDYVVMDMNYTNDGDWEYETVSVSDISSLSDLNGAIMNLNRYNDDIQYERFSSTSTSSNISKSERQSLSGLLVGIEYDDYVVEYELLQIN